MPKIPYKSKKKNDEEAASFESFSDNGSGRDSLTLNDNINYQLYYEKRAPGETSSSQCKNEGSHTELRETSLSSTTTKHTGVKSNITEESDGKFYPRNGKYAFLNRMKHTMPKRTDNSEGSSERGSKYERFSEQRYVNNGFCGKLPELGSGILVFIVVCVLCVVVWWGVWRVVGGAWGEEHYRRLYERAHPQIMHTSHPNQNHHTHYSPSVIVHQQLERLDPISFEPKYHDHNNLSTKNKNASETIKHNKQKLEGNDSDTKKNLSPIDLNTEKPIISESPQCTLVSDDMRFDCLPEAGANEQTCIDRGCCWIPHNIKKPVTRFKINSPNYESSIGLPYCFYPMRYGNYHYTNITETRQGMTAYLEKQFPSSYPGDVNVVAINVKYLSDNMLQIKIYDAEKKRFEPPFPEIPVVSKSINSMQYRVFLEASKLGFKLIRVSDNTVILDSQEIGGFIFSDKFLQMSFLLPSSNIYGIGEHQGRFLLKSDWQRYTLFNHDTAPVENTNLYGSHPFYMIMERSGNSHGVFLLNSNAMDVILQPAPAITFRTVGGIFNFLVMMGPEPGNVVSQYTSLIGRPFMPPYWSLGFHLCKYDYGSLNKTREVWRRTRNAGIPFDVQWNDLDYMNNSNVFTYDNVMYKGLPEFVKEVHDSGMHYIPLIDPGVSASELPGTYPPFDKGLDLNIFIKNNSDQPFIGKVWNTASTVWPDFTNPNITSYWIEMLTILHRNVPYDGLWIDMNEPSNFLSGPLHGECLKEDLPYTPNVGGSQGLKSGTICMDAKQFGGDHFDLHNLFSLTEAVVTNFALTEIRGKRPFIISRSSFPGLGKYAGHWSGDIFSEWYDMKMTIPQMLSFSLFGIPMMGSDICGFNGNTTAELCRRWMELGAFYPFSRNHNSDKSIEQDPVILGPMVAMASKKALTARYTLLPYLYTLFFRAYMYGETVARPVFFDFAHDNQTYGLDQQFMWGPYLMIVPILDPGVTSVKTYLPKVLWYKFSSFSLLGFSGWGTLNETDTLLVKGGGIIPLQTPDDKKNGPINTSNLRSRPLQLLVALDPAQNAKGTLFWDDGESLNTHEEEKYSLINFISYMNTLKSEVVLWGFGVPCVDKIYILGHIQKVTAVYLDDKPIHFTYNKTIHLLTVDKLNLPLDHVFTLKWE